jgi:hypothetical protein
MAFVIVPSLFLRIYPFVLSDADFSLRANVAARAKAMAAATMKKDIW